MTPDELTKITDAVEKKIDEKVNGKIIAVHDILVKQNEAMDAFVKKVDKHIERVEPAIKSFEESVVFKTEVGKIGERTMLYAKILGAIGVIVLAIKFGIVEILNYKP
jgi:energy-converting hydrogenase Eha subunit A